MPDNDEFIRSMENATLKMVMDMSRKMDKACLVVESQAKQNCPVDIGILRAYVTRQPRADTGSYFSATSHRKERKVGNQNIHIFHQRKHIYTG